MSKQVDIKTIQYDNATLSQNVSEHLVRSLSNLGQRYGESGNGLETLSKKLKEVFTDFDLVNASNIELSLDTDGLFWVNEKSFGSLSQSIPPMDNSGIQEITDHKAEDDFFEVSFKIEDETYKVTIYNGKQGFAVDCSEYKIEINKDNTHTLTRKDNNTPYTIDWFAQDENGYTDLYSCKSDDDIEKFCADANKVYEYIHKPNGICTAINNSYMDGNKQYINLLKSIYTCIVEELEFTDIPRLEGSKPKVNILLTDGAKDFDMNFVVDSKNKHIKYIPNNINIHVVSDDNAAENTTQLGFNVSGCALKENTTRTVNLTTYLKTKTYNPSTTSDDYAISINEFCTNIESYEPYIHKNNNTWVVNNTDTKISAVGKNAGQPYILFVNTIMNGDNNVTGNIVFGAFDSINNFKKIFKDEYGNDLAFAGDYKECQIVNSYSSEFNNGDSLTTTFVFAMISLEGLDENAENQIRNTLVVNTSNICRSKDDENGNFIENDNDADLGHVGKVTTFWVCDYVDDKLAWSPLNNDNVDGSVMDLFDFNNTRYLTDYIFNAIKKNDIIDDKIESYNFNDIKFKKQAIVGKNTEKVDILPYISCNLKDSTAITIKPQFATESINNQFVTDNKYFLNTLSNSSSMSAYTSDYDGCGGAPTFDLSEILGTNFTVIDRYNIMLLEYTDSNKTMVNAIPHYTYVGCSPEGYDGYFHIGTATTNSALGNNKLASESYSSNLQVVENGFISDFKYNTFSNILLSSIVQQANASVSSNIVSFASSTAGMYVLKLFAYSSENNFIDMMQRLSSKYTNGSIYAEKIISFPLTDNGNVASMIDSLSSGESFLHHIYSDNITATLMSINDTLSTKELTVYNTIKLSGSGKMVLGEGNNGYFLSNNEVKFNKATIESLNANRIVSKYVEIQNTDNTSNATILTDNDNMVIIDADFANIRWRKQTINLGNDDSGKNVTAITYTTELKLIGQDCGVWVYSNGDKHVVKVKDFTKPSTMVIEGWNLNYYPYTALYNNMFLTLYDYDSTEPSKRIGLPSAKTGAKPIASYINVLKLIEDNIPSIFNKYKGQQQQIYLDFDTSVLVNDSNNNGSMWYSYNGDLNHCVDDILSNGNVSISNSNIKYTFKYYPLFKLNTPLTSDNIINITTSNTVSNKIMISNIITILLSEYNNKLYVKLIENNQATQLSSIKLYYCEGNNTIQSMPSYVINENDSITINIKDCVIEKEIELTKKKLQALKWYVNGNESMEVTKDNIITVFYNPSFNGVELEGNEIRTNTDIRLVGVFGSVQSNYPVNYYMNRCIVNGQGGILLSDTNSMGGKLLTQVLHNESNMDLLPSPPDYTGYKPLKNGSNYWYYIENGVKKYVNEINDKVTKLMCDYYVDSNILQPNDTDSIMTMDVEYIYPSIKNYSVTKPYTWNYTKILNTQSLLDGMPIYLDENEAVPSDYYTNVQMTELINNENKQENNAFKTSTFRTKLYVRPFVSYTLQISDRNDNSLVGECMSINSEPFTTNLWGSDTKIGEWTYDGDSKGTYSIQKQYIDEIITIPSIHVNNRNIEKIKITETVTDKDGRNPKEITTTLLPNVTQLSIDNIYSAYNETDYNSSYKRISSSNIVPITLSYVMGDGFLTHIITSYINIEIDNNEINFENTVGTDIRVKYKYNGQDIDITYMFEKMIIYENSVLDMTNSVTVTLNSSDRALDDSKSHIIGDNKQVRLYFTQEIYDKIQRNEITFQGYISSDRRIESSTWNISITTDRKNINTLEFIPYIYNENDYLSTSTVGKREFICNNLQIGIVNEKGELMLKRFQFNQESTMYYSLSTSENISENITIQISVYNKISKEYESIDYAFGNERAYAESNGGNTDANIWDTYYTNGEYGIKFMIKAIDAEHIGTVYVGYNLESYKLRVIPVIENGVNVQSYRLKVKHSNSFLISNSKLTNSILKEEIDVNIGNYVIVPRNYKYLEGICLNNSTSIYANAEFAYNEYTETPKTYTVTPMRISYGEKCILHVKLKKIETAATSASLETSQTTNTSTGSGTTTSTSGGGGGNYNDLVIDGYDYTNNRDKDNNFTNNFQMRTL